MKAKYIRESLWIFFHSIKVGYQLMASFFRLTRLPMPIVTIFGGAKADKTGLYAKKAHDLSSKFVKNGISVITGGGPGIMAAASCGAVELKEEGKKARTLGISVSGIEEDFFDPCSDILHVNYFFMRKWLLIRYSMGFVVFPGGIGTMDELFDLLNLMKHNRIPDLPVVLVGVEYWNPLIQWFHESAFKNGLIDERLTKLFIVTDSVDEAYETIYDMCEYYLND